MIIYPAIDIKGGRCVRLFQGRMDQETVYSENPVEVACRWQTMGAEIVHVVDLDGAVTGKPVNTEIIREIISTLKVPVQIGGGIRDQDTVMKYLEMGAHRVVLGTAAAGNVNLVHDISKACKGKIVISLDASNGMIAVKGWTEITDLDAVETARRFEGMGISAIVFTDIGRDGTLSGPNIESISRLAHEVRIPVIASGGVSGMNDIKSLLKIKDPGIEGVIVGKALYSGAIDLKEAIAFTRNSC